MVCSIVCYKCLKLNYKLMCITKTLNYIVQDQAQLQMF